MIALNIILLEIFNVEIITKLLNFRIKSKLKVHNNNDTFLFYKEPLLVLTESMWYRCLHNKAWKSTSYFLDQHLKNESEIFHSWWKSTKKYKMSVQMIKTWDKHETYSRIWHSTPYMISTWRYLQNQSTQNSVLVPFLSHFQPTTKKKVIKLDYSKNTVDSEPLGCQAEVFLSGSLLQNGRI